MTLPCASTLPCETTGLLQRAEGAAELTVRVAAGRTRIASLYQRGCMKLRFPRQPDMEAIIVNTAGGLAGGDRLSLDFAVGDHAGLTVTTQAAERVYRAVGGAAHVDVRVALGDSARFAWLPQETILYDAAELNRTLTVDARGDSVFLLCESVILGRAAMGEVVRRGVLRDRWRIRRDGRLAYADNLVLSGDIEALGARAAVLNGARAFATIVAQGRDERLADIRAHLPADGGATLVDGLLVVRIAAADGLALRRSLPSLLQKLTDAALPRIWLT